MRGMVKTILELGSMELLWELWRGSMEKLWRIGRKLLNQEVGNGAVFRCLERHSSFH